MLLVFPDKEVCYTEVEEKACPYSTIHSPFIPQRLVMENVKVVHASLSSSGHRVKLSHLTG